MIFTEKKITINNNQCKIDSPVVLYRGDYNVEVRFTIISSPYKYSNKQETNVIEQTEASYGQLVIKTPGDRAPIFSEVTATKKGSITFTITAEMIDEASEVGNYTFQIRLLDENKESRATIPEVENGIEIREPIASEDVTDTNEVGVATVGYALTTAATNEDAFDLDGNYNKTTWGTGDRITASKLNKIEAGIDGVNQKIASGGSGGTGSNNAGDISIADTGNYFTSTNVEGALQEAGSQIKDIANNIVVENTGFKATTLKGILQEIYNALSNNGLLDEFKITTGSNIPEVYFVGDTTNMTKETPVDLAITVRINNFEWNGTSNTKWQGSSSLAYPKKNFTIKLYEDSTKANKQKFDFNDWGKQNKFCLKANYIDHSHARNIVSAKIWSEIVASRSDYADLPQELRTSPNNCEIDGFPIKVYINDAYQGIYTWNIPKDGWMFNMDKNNNNHAVLCAEVNNNDSSTTNVSKLAVEFRHEANIDGSDWSLEVPDTLNSNIKTNFNNLISFVMNSNDTQFKYGIGQYLDIQSAIDYYIYAYYGGFIDSLGKNLIMMTYDGKKWFASMYDMDSTWGLFYTGSQIINSNIQCPEQYQETNSLLWQRIEKLFAKEIKERYSQLRSSILNVEHITNMFNNFMNIIGTDLYSRDLEVYPNIPLGTLDHAQQINEYVTARSTYVDSEINALTEIDLSQIPVTSLSLDKNSISLSLGNENIIDVNLNENLTAGKEIYGSNEAGTATTTKLLTGLIDVNDMDNYLYVLDVIGATESDHRYAFYTAEGSIVSTNVLNRDLGKSCLNSVRGTNTYPYIKVMTNSIDGNNTIDTTHLFKFSKNYLAGVLEDYNNDIITGTGDVYAPLSVTPGSIVVIQGDANYWTGISFVNTGTDVYMNSKSSDYKAIFIPEGKDTVYFKINTAMYTAGKPLKYKVFQPSDLIATNSETLVATLTPSNATNQIVTWSSSDDTKVTVSANGLQATITAIGTGNVTITCTSEDITNGNIANSCEVVIS